MKQEDLFQGLQLDPMPIPSSHAFKKLRDAIREAFEWRHSAFTTGMSVASLDLYVWASYLYQAGEIDFTTWFKAKRLSERCDRLMDLELQAERAAGTAKAKGIVTRKGRHLSAGEHSE